jgi:hypothetical protein
MVTVQSPVKLRLSSVDAAVTGESACLPAGGLAGLPQAATNNTPSRAMLREQRHLQNTRDERIVVPPVEREAANVQVSGVSREAFAGEHARLKRLALCCRDF